MDFFGFKIPSVTDAANAVSSIPKTIVSTAVKASAPAVLGNAISKVNLSSLPKTVTSSVSNVVRSVPKLPLPTVSLPKVPTTKDIKNNPVGAVLKVSPVALVPGATQAIDAAGHTVSSAVSKITLPSTKAKATTKRKTPAKGAVQEDTTSKTDLLSLPSGAANVAGTASGLIDTAINARDQSYADAATRLASGDTAAGGAQLATTMAADVMLPLDAVNVTNKLLTGRADELTTEDYAYAALDAVGILGSVFTFGGSYALTRALKASKLAKMGKTVPTGAKMSKIGAITGALKAFRTTTKATKEGGSSLSALKTLQATKAATAAKASTITKALKTKAAKTTLGSSLKSTRTTTRLPRTTKATKVRSTGTIGDLSRRMSNLENLKSTESAKVMDALEGVQKSTTKSIKDLSKSVSESLDAFGNLKTAGKTESAWTRAGKALKYGMIGGTIGSVGAAALGAFGHPTEETPAGNGDENQNDPNADLDGNGIPDWFDAWLASLTGGDEGDGGAGAGDDGTGGEYTPAAYYDPLGLESGAQDVLGGLEDVPVVGDVATAANENGVALPVLLIGGLVVVGGAVYFFKKTKTGRKITTKVSGAVKSAGKTAKKAASG